MQGKRQFAEMQRPGYSPLRFVKPFHTFMHKQTSCGLVFFDAELLTSSFQRLMGDFLVTVESFLWPGQGFLS